ncbi:PilZ domain-containing protein [Sphingobium sp. Sx8-8]|uniref:PilZ domain-containing protein n=1 Tax=Sphingobium sp. Sx8-8 TaxID=2933617 RepID=UPI001F5AA71B|nr:PilZ domain-containing protein [Sphingobium sp. Sx8-8]
MSLPDQSGNEAAPGDAANRPQAPREARVTTILLIGKMFSRHGEALCRIRNLSSGGLMAEAHVPLTEDDPVRIELKAGDQLSGRVRWTTAGRMGIAFDQPIEVGETLARAMVRTAEQGLVRAPRFAVDCPVELRSDGRRHTGRLINVSQGGARLEADLLAEKDQLLTLQIPGLPERRGGVRWVGDGALGLSFVEPFAFDELGLWLIAQRPSV